MWGAEIIHAVIEGGRGRSVVQEIEIDEEISYMQGKVFTNFVEEIWQKHRLATNQVQKDLLELILDSFHVKFSQKYFGIQ